MKSAHNIARIEAFSDAIFAFAATLMVVSLDLSGDLKVLENETFQFVSFGISFFVLIMIWKVHYDFFRRSDYMDNWILTLNSVFLFLVLYFIFPLRSLVGSALQQKPMGVDALANTFTMYGLGFTLLFLCIALMYLRAYKKSGESQNKFKLLEKSRHFGVFVIVGTISMAFSLLNIGVEYGLPGFLYSLVGPLSYINGVRFNKKHPNSIE